MQVKPCPCGGPDHEYEDDWKFGGADGTDPAADPRFEPTHYQYLDAELGFSYLSGQFRCDYAALDYFTVLAENDNPKYIAVKRPGMTKFELMPFIYIKETDTVHPYKFRKDK